MSRYDFRIAEVKVDVQVTLFLLPDVPSELEQSCIWLKPRDNLNWQHWNIFSGHIVLKNSSISSEEVTQENCSIIDHL